VDCENLNCPFRSPLRKILRRGKNEGVLLQGRWYCSLDCFEEAITGVFNGLLRLPDEPLPRLHRVPLGLLLLGRGVITDSQLKSALQAQREGGTDRLGRWLIRLGVASAQDVSAALAAQWGCGVFSLERDQRYRECSQMLPFALLESSHMIPVHYLPTSQLLFVAFSEDIDHTALYAVERLVGGHTEPCIVTEAAMNRALEEIRAVSRPAEIVFETLWDAPEMARTIRDYAVKLNADELILARPRRFVWVRLRASGRSWDLLFRLPVGKIAERASLAR
jgi:hypothetical protein